MHWVILGCGYVGMRLARALLADGESVRACTRHLERLETLVALGADVHRVDAQKLRSFGPALYGARSPIVVYSIPPVAGVPPGEAVHRAADAAMAVGAERFIYLSSTSVYGETPDGETVDEDSSLSLSDPEALPRISEETAVQTARLTGLSTVILRLSAIYGPGRGVRERIKAGTYRLLDDGTHHFSRVHVDDLVAIVRRAAVRAPAGALYCVSDDRPTTQREYADWLTVRLGTAPLSSVPTLAPGLPRRAVRNRRISNARLKRELEYSFRYPSFVEGELAIEAESSGTVPEPVPVPRSSPSSRPETGVSGSPVPVPAAMPVDQSSPSSRPGTGVSGSPVAAVAREVELRWWRAILDELASGAADDEILQQLLNLIAEQRRRLGFTGITLPEGVGSMRERIRIRSGSLAEQLERLLKPE